MGKRQHKKQKQLPSRADLIDCDHTVAGHAGTMVDASGEFFVKPCTKAEIDFYNEAQAHPEFADLMPLFYGTLQLNESAEVSSVEDGVAGPVASAEAKEELTQAVTGQSSADAPEQDKDKWVQNKSKKIKTDQSIVLENSRFGFTNPNTLDVKLGKRLWADDAPTEKKERFDKITEETTHKELGFRIAGMWVYHGSKDPEELNDEGYKKYSKDYGRTDVNKGNIVENFRKFIFNDIAGIDEALGVAVCRAFLNDLREVERVLANEESRMYSASLLFMFEGDGKKLEEAIAKNNEAAEEAESKVEKPGRVDSGIALVEDDDDDDEPKLPQIYSLKLIDFAHASFVPGEGPDENVLLGVRSLIKIFEELAQ